MQKDSMKTVQHLTGTSKTWKTIYHSVHGRWFAPNIAQDDRTTHVQGFYTLQDEKQEKEDRIDTLCHDNMT